MNAASAATTLELHAIGDVEFRLVYVDCGRSTCRPCRLRPSHGPYWYATWQDDGEPQQLYVGKTLQVDELRERFGRDGRTGHRAVADLLRRVATFEKRVDSNAAHRQREEEERWEAMRREREAERRFAQARAARVREAERIFERARASQSDARQRTAEPESATGKRPSPGDSTGGRPGRGDDGRARARRVDSVADGPWAVLGLAKTATSDEIRKRYRSLAKALHPDRGGDAEQMKRLNEAFQQLERQGAVE